MNLCKPEMKETLMSASSSRRDDEGKERQDADDTVNKKSDTISGGNDEV